MGPPEHRQRSFLLLVCATFFLERQQCRIDSGEVSRRHFGDNLKSWARLVKHVGKFTKVSAMKAVDFAAYCIHCPLGETPKSPMKSSVFERCSNGDSNPNFFSHRQTLAPTSFGQVAMFRAGAPDWRRVPIHINHTKGAETQRQFLDLCDRMEAAERTATAILDMHKPDARCAWWQPYHDT